MYQICIIEKWSPYKETMVPYKEEICGFLIYIYGEPHVYGSATLCRTGLVMICIILVAGHGVVLEKEIMVSARYEALLRA